LSQFEAGSFFLLDAHHEDIYRNAYNPFQMWR
jgi:hypothetical protein